MERLKCRNWNRWKELFSRETMHHSKLGQAQAMHRTHTCSVLARALSLECAHGKHWLSHERNLVCSPALLPRSLCKKRYDSMFHFLQNHRKPTVFLWLATVFLRLVPANQTALQQQILWNEHSCIFPMKNPSNQRRPQGFFDSKDSQRNFGGF